MITLKEHITNYAKNNSYSHINDLRKYFTDRRIDYKKDTLKKYLYLLKKENVIYGAGRGWYSTIKHDFVLDTKPVEKIIALIKEKMRAMCMNTKSTYVTFL
jgi:hypothetical protein